MEYTEAQKEAFYKVDHWLRHETKKQQVFSIFGYAGVGKTTITKDLVSRFDGEVLYAAFTGKAAMVMNRHGMPASTIHSLIYTYRPPKKVGNQPSFILNHNSALNDADLLVLDEVSFVNEEVGKDLESFGVPTLVLGDPGQLPPVKGTGYFVQRKPDVMLTEIHRQAEGNPIIALSVKARNGVAIKLGSHGDTKVITKSQVNDDLLMAHDQVLVGKHKTRRWVNNRLRDCYGFSGRYPQAGERLICLKNERDKALLNGMMCEVEAADEDAADGIFLKLVTEEGNKVETVAHKGHFDAYEDPDVMKGLDWKILRDFSEFDFGYAITVHKAQGSQWDKVLFWDDLFGTHDQSLRRQWLYTGITRAAESLTFVRPG